MTRILLLAPALSTALVGQPAEGLGPTNSFPRYERPVMTWVSPYAVDQSKQRLLESYGGVGMRDALTHLGLQFWVPTKEGGLARSGRTNETSDAAIAELRDWGRTNGVRVLLCVHNHVGSWSWELARAAFAEHSGRFIDALMREMHRHQLDGVDIDLEGSGALDADKDAFVAFIRVLGARLRAEDRHLTVDSFSYVWSAPNQTWWKDLFPHVDGLTTMGYEQIGATAPGWRSYEFQKAAAGEHAAKLMIGLPSRHDEWRGNSVLEHLEWLQADREVGVSFWDARLRSERWRQPEVWKALRDIRGER